MLVKICGMDDPTLVKIALRSGVDLIGVILTATSKRFLGIEKAMQVIDAIKIENSKPVLVFRNESFETIASIVEKVGDCIVQFQGKNHPDTKKLMESFETMVAFSATEFSTMAFDSYFKIASKKTMLIIDSENPGSGKPFCWDQFKPPSFPWFLAGGLNSRNLNHAITQLKPTGVDVSTGVENNDGKKEIELIKNFIKSAKAQVIY